MKDNEIFELCKGVFRNDKTTYQYPNNCSSEDIDKALNRFDEMPDSGQRWATPMELAEEFIREHFPDRHQELYE